MKSPPTQFSPSLSLSVYKYKTISTHIIASFSPLLFSSCSFFNSIEDEDSFMEMEEAKNFNTSSSSSSSCCYYQEVAKGQRTKRRRARPPPPPPGPTTSSASSAEFSSGITEEDEDMANCLVLLSRGRSTLPSAKPGPSVYECRTCNKRFPSFQALGGHRASHKKAKPTTAAPEEITSSDFSKQPPPPPQADKSRVHECAICGSEFSSGQALGGHMRRHRPIVAVAAAALPEITNKKRISVIPLDLNLPAPEDDDHDDHARQQLGFTIIDGQQPIVFSAAPLVDCQN